VKNGGIVPRKVRYKKRKKISEKYNIKILKDMVRKPGKEGKKVFKNGGIVPRKMRYKRRKNTISKSE
jgi:hypothetical protein